jgi:hypothetical protein
MAEENGQSMRNQHRMASWLRNDLKEKMAKKEICCGPGWAEIYSADSCLFGTDVNSGSDLKVDFQFSIFIISEFQVQSDSLNNARSCHAAALPRGPGGLKISIHSQSIFLRSFLFLPVF